MDEHVCVSKMTSFHILDERQVHLSDDWQAYLIFLPTAHLLFLGFFHLQLSLFIHLEDELVDINIELDTNALNHIDLLSVVLLLI